MVAMIRDDLGSTVKSTHRVLNARRSPMRKIQRRRLPDQIIEQILSMIAKGKLAVGDLLPSERVLMQQLGVGRSSLREAMGALSLMGIVSIRSGHGTQVVASPEGRLEDKLRWNSLRREYKVQELAEARTVLEEAIAGLAVQRANEQDIGELRAQLIKLESATKKKNRRKLAEADWAFHMALAKASHNVVLIRFLSEIRQPIRIWMKRSANSAVYPVYDLFEKQHAAILEAIEAKDPEGAKVAVRRNIEYD